MKKLLLLLLLLGSSVPIYAGVIFASEISYRCISNKKFEVTLKLYRSCQSTPLGNPGIFALICSSSGTTRAISYSKISIRDVTPHCGTGATPCTPANTTVSNYGVEEHTYTGIIDFNITPLSTDLSNGCCEFRIYYDECCRSGAINTGNSGINNYVEALLNVCLAPQNNSPRSANPPVVKICCNQPYYHSAATTDTLDNDSLAFSLVAPKGSATTTFTYSPGFSAKNPLSSATSSSGVINMNANPPVGFGIDSLTGFMAFFASNCGETGPVAVQCREYRKDSLGIYRKIGETTRDFLLTTTSCAGNNVPTFTAPYSANVCAGNTICLDVVSRDNPFLVPPPATSSPGDTLRLSIDRIWAGATFTILDTNAREKTGRFCWTPVDSNIRNAPYTFTATAVEKKCSGTPSSSSRTYYIRVFKNYTASRSITKLTCGKYKLSADGSDSSLTYQWSVKDSTGKAVAASQANKATSLLRLDTVQFLKKGRYFISLRVSNPAGCTRDFFDTIRTDEILGAALKADTLVCRDIAASLNAAVVGGVAPFKYKWISNPHQASNDSSAVYTFQPRGQNSVQLLLTDADGCMATANSTVRISGKFTLGADTQICNYHSLNLSGPSKVISYNWSVGSTAKSISINTAGTYILNTIDSMGCAAADTIVIKVSGKFQLDRDTFTCSKAPITLGGPAGWAQYKWNTGSSNKDLTVTDSGKYILETTDNFGCSHKDSVMVNNYPRPDLDFNGGTRIMCKGGSVTLDAGPGYAWYYWSTGQTSQSITVKDMRTYSVAVLNDFGCGTKDSVNIMVDSVPAFDWYSYALAQRIFEFVPYTIGPFDYTWDFGDGITSKAVQTSHHFTSPGTYKVCLILRNGNMCYDTVCKSVQAYGITEKIDALNIRIMPNPFTDQLSILIYFDAYSELSISLRDITGREVYSTGSEYVVQGEYTRTFDLKNLFLPAGVYHAVVTINSVQYYIKLVHLD